MTSYSRISPAKAEGVDLVAKILGNLGFSFINPDYPSSSIACSFEKSGFEIAKKLLFMLTEEEKLTVVINKVDSLKERYRIWIDQLA